MDHDNIKTQIRELSQKEIKMVYSTFLEQLDEESEFMSEQEILEQYNQNCFLLEEYANQYIGIQGQEDINEDILCQILECFAESSEAFGNQIINIIHGIKDKRITLVLPISDFAVNIILVSIAIAMLKPHISYEKKRSKKEESVKFELKTEPAEKLNEIISLILSYIKSR